MSVQGDIGQRVSTLGDHMTPGGAREKEGLTIKINPVSEFLSALRQGTRSLQSFIIVISRFLDLYGRHLVLKADARKEKHIRRRRSVRIWRTHRWTGNLGTHLSRRTGWTGFEERSQSRYRFLIKEKPRGRRPLGKAAPCSEG